MVATLAARINIAGLAIIEVLIGTPRDQRETVGIDESK